MSYKANPQGIQEKGGPVRTTLAKISHHAHHLPKRPQARQKLANRIARAVVEIAKENSICLQATEIENEILQAMEEDFAGWW